MQGFDPDKFIQETEPSQEFDPDAFLKGTEEQPQAAVQTDDSHDLIPTAKRFASGLLDLGGKAVGGAVSAALHPEETLSNVADSLGGIDSEGVYRAVRNTPVAGPAIDSIVQSSKALGALVSGKGKEGAEKEVADYKKSQAEMDKKHAEEHPLTDFIQRSVGSLPFAPEQAGVLAADAFGKSLDAGNDTWTAMKDARNALVLAGAAVAAGKGIKSLLGKATDSIPENLGVSDEAIEAYKANPSQMGETISSLKKGITPEVPVDSVASDVESGIKNFPTKEQLSSALHPEAPVASMPSPDIDLAKQFLAGSNQGTHYADLGAKLGGSAGGAVGGIAGHYAGAAVGVPVGVTVGKAAGRLIDTYGAPAVKTALDAGIMLDKIADTPFVGPLMKAASEGSQSLAVSHYLLSQMNPEYQQLSNSSK